jgi:hypothetical protein
MKNKKIMWGVVGAVVIAGAAFYGGDVYGKGSAMAARGNFAAGAFARGGATGAAGARAGGGAVAGQVISADATSITVKAADGSTKIILVGGSTEIMKTAAGTIKDLPVGANVVVTGSTNSDGSVTATSVQVRPAGMQFGGRPATTTAQ